MKLIIFLLLAAIITMILGACTTTYEVSSIDWDTGVITWERKSAWDTWDRRFF